MKEELESHKKATKRKNSARNSEYYIFCLCKKTPKNSF